MSAPVVVGVLGVGEAGSLIASGLISGGAVVRCYDPSAPGPDHVEKCATTAEAVRGADVVLALCTAEAALDCARAAALALGEGQLYADCNTAAPALKRDVAKIVEPSGALMADVALMTPVPGRGVATPAAVCGPGASSFAATMSEFGMPVEVLDGEPGVAAARKLVRSIFVKGLAAAVGEALDAASQLGLEGWLREDIVKTLAGADIARVVDGTRKHALRRGHEMQAAAELLVSLGIPPTVSAAVAQWHLDLAAGEV